MMAIRKCTMRLLLLTLFVCLVQCKPAERVKRRSCREGMVDLAGDCVPVRMVKSLAMLLCEISSYLSKDNVLSGLNKFCPRVERRIWGNDGFLEDNDKDDEKRLWGNDGYRRFETENKRAWWHSGLKPDRR